MRVQVTSEVKPSLSVSATQRKARSYDVPHARKRWERSMTIKPKVDVKNLVRELADNKLRALELVV
jgi:hypothetical protein